MITKEQLLALLEGKTEIISEHLSEKAEIVTTDIVEQLGEAMLVEMTPGHKEMVKQHIDAATDIEYDADGNGTAKPKKTVDGRIKNPKRPDDRDEYNELGDFDVTKGKGPKIDKSHNFGAKKYTQNERALRSEEVEQLDEVKFRSKYSENIYNHQYNKDSVDKAIASSTRSGRKIGKKEGKLIHALLKGHSKPKAVKEAVEPLMELSTGKMRSYRRKALSQLGGEDYPGKEIMRKRNKGMKMSHGKILKKSTGVADKLKNTFFGESVENTMEPLMELSRKTLANYVHAAGHDQIRNYQKADKKERDYHKSQTKNRLDWAVGKKSDGQHYADADELDRQFKDDDKKITRKVKNRLTGIGRALTRLSKD